MAASSTRLGTYAMNTSVSGVLRLLQWNSRIGATVVVPLTPHHAIRASYSTGIVTHSGGDYDTFTASYAYIW